MDVDAALAEVRRRSAGRTRYEGQPPYADEVLAEEVERLRAALHRLIDAPRYPCDELHEAFRHAEEVAR